MSSVTRGGPNTYPVFDNKFVYKNSSSEERDKYIGGPEKKSKYVGDLAQNILSKSAQQVKIGNDLYEISNKPISQEKIPGRNWADGSKIEVNKDNDGLKLEVEHGDQKVIFNLTKK